jgi:glucose/mannose transport system permease protein
MARWSARPLTALAAAAVPRVRSRRRRFRFERALVPLILAPSLIAIAVFVYAFIVFTGWVSVSNWNTLKVDLSLNPAPLETYAHMFGMPSFQASFRNTIVFTVLFLGLSVGGGLGLALLLHHNIRGKAAFRSLFMFPYALSFVVTGVVWRWLFNPETGINTLFDITGVNGVLSTLGIGPLHPGWLTDATVVGSVNDVLASVLPGAASLQIEFGIPMALIPVVIAAAWQLGGFAMAMYLAGLSAIPEDTMEAAEVDGATTWQTYRRVVVPMLLPVTISNLVLLGYTSLKIFDLVYVMSGVGPNFGTDVFGIFVFEETFKAGRYNLGAAASIVMLVLVCIFVVPYLVRNLRSLR